MGLYLEPSGLSPALWIGIMYTSFSGKQEIEQMRAFYQWFSDQGDSKSGHGMLSGPGFTVHLLNYLLNCAGKSYRNQHSELLCYWMQN